MTITELRGETTPRRATVGGTPILCHIIHAAAVYRHGRHYQPVSLILDLPIPKYATTDDNFTLPIPHIQRTPARVPRGHTPPVIIET